MEIGLGPAQRITRLEVRWPNGGAVQEFADVPMDSWVRVTEGESARVRLELRRFTF